VTRSSISPHTGKHCRGLNLCGAGRVVCLIDPVGDVYACPFAIHEAFLAGAVRSAGGFAKVWRESDLFLELRRPQTGGACTKCQHFDSTTPRSGRSAAAEGSRPPCFR
jgi:radical SAM protein with 4Fe4S-binding SPASM domain